MPQSNAKLALGVSKCPAVYPRPNLTVPRFQPLDFSWTPANIFIFPPSDARTQIHLGSCRFCRFFRQMVSAALLVFVVSLFILDFFSRLAVCVCVLAFASLENTPRTKGRLFNPICVIFSHTTTILVALLIWNLKTLKIRLCMCLRHQLNNMVDLRYGRVIGSKMWK